MKVDEEIKELLFRNADIWQNEDDVKVLTVDLYYPKQEQFDTIELDVVSTRVTDGIRIKYDFERNGWSISKLRVEDDDCRTYEKWEEVSFIGHSE